MSTAALVLLILYVLVMAVLLIDDGHRAIRGQITFTQWATAPGKRYRLWLLFAASLIGPAALLVHFLTF